MSVTSTENCLFYINERGGLIVTGSFGNKQIANTDASKSKRFKHIHFYANDADNNELPQFNFISAGSKHAIAIDVTGQAWVIGSLKHGVGGFESANNFSFVPMPIPMSPFHHAKVLLTACGTDHSLVLTTFGAFSTGSNNFGQTGMPVLVHLSSNSTNIR
jgi:alpha-tubulin suppressor-like RCC1 family protein